MAVSLTHTPVLNRKVARGDYNSTQHLLTGTAGKLLGFNGSGNPVEVDPGIQTAASMAALIALASPAIGDTRIVIDDARFGFFEVEAAADHTAAIAADPQKAVYAQSTADATKVWVRKGFERYEISWFGAQKIPAGTASGSYASYDIKGALDAFQTLVRATGYDLVATYRVSNFALHIPWGNYYCSTWDMTDALTIEGDEVSDQRDRSLGTTINGPDDANLWIINRHNTLGSATVSSRGYGADGARVRNIAFGGWNGVVAGASPTGIGVWCRARATFENCIFGAFGGHGVQVLAYAGSGGSVEGNANTCTFINCTFTSNGGYGLYNEGADANVLTTVACKFRYNRLGAMREQSFLGGGTHVGLETESNCVSDYTGCGRATPVVVYSGAHYVPVPGNEVAASTNAPSGTATDNAWWLYSAGVNGSHPTWTSGITVIAGGTITVPLSTTELLISGYHEGGQPAIYLGQRALMTGASGVTSTGPGLHLRGEGGALKATAFATARASLGSYADTTAIMSWLSGNETLVISDAAAGNYIDAKFSGASGGQVFRLYDPDSDVNYTNGTLEISQLMVSKFGWQQLGTGRRLAFIDSTADINTLPVNVGDIFFYRGPTVGGVLGLVCTTAGAVGSTATLTNFGIVGAIQATAQADTAAADLAALKVDFNALLAKLRTAKLIAT